MEKQLYQPGVARVTLENDMDYTDLIELRKDAARYRWLRSVGGKQGKSAGFTIYKNEARTHADMLFSYWVPFEQIDAAIDAAIQEKQP